MGSCLQLATKNAVGSVFMCRSFKDSVYLIYIPAPLGFEDELFLVGRGGRFLKIAELKDSLGHTFSHSKLLAPVVVKPAFYTVPGDCVSTLT